SPISGREEGLRKGRGEVDRGGWNLRDMRVWKSGNDLNSWVCLVVRNGHGRPRSQGDALQANIGTFTKLMRNMGIGIGKPLGTYQAANDSEGELRKAFQAMITKYPQLKLVLVLLPDNL